MIQLELPSLPISVNHAYMHIVAKGRVLRVLTKEGRAYQKETTAYLASHYPAELALFNKATPYLIYVILYVPDIYTKGWPKKAASRYKRLDATNRLKLLEDVLTEVTAVDDSNNLMVAVHKRHGEVPRTVIRAWDLENEDTPFDAAIRS